MSELRGLGAIDRELRSRGGRLLAVSADSPEVSRRTAEQHDVGYTLLSDARREVIEAYGVLHPDGGLEGGTSRCPPTS
jgi:peroxiredoxin